MTRTAPPLVHLLVRTPPGAPLRFRNEFACGAANVAAEFGTLNVAMVTCQACRASVETKATGAAA